MSSNVFSDLKFLDLQPLRKWQQTKVGNVLEWEITFRPYQQGSYFISFDLSHLRKVLARYRAKYTHTIQHLDMQTFRKPVAKSPGSFYRKRIILGGGITEYIVKSRSSISVRDDSYAITAVLSTEQPASEVANYTQTQRSERWRLNLQDDFFLDITHWRNDDEKKDYYFYELETNNIDAIGLTSSKTTEAFLLIYGGLLPFTIQEWETTQDAMRQIFPELFPFRLLANARNLQLQDLTYYGLIGNIFTHYRITHKADGERVLLIHYQDSLWEQQIPYELRKLANLTTSPDSPISVFESERIVSGENYTYLVYDTLAINGRSILSSSHLDRMDAYASWAEQRNSRGEFNLLSNVKISIDSKKFYDLGGVDSFYQTVRERENDLRQKKVGYDTDGYIFMPAETPYPSGSPSVRVSLHSSPAICKWKPAEKITIDFLLRDGKLHYRSKGRLVLFRGTERYPYDPQILPNSEDLNGSIVEVAFINDPVQNKLIPRIERTRLDKLTPNHPDVIFDNWRMIHEPITIETLLGKNLQLMRIYHNNIKRILLSSYDGYLLDLGSGRGGDLQKWRNYRRVVAVEPSLEYIRELVDRFFNLYPQKSVVLISDEEGANMISGNPQLQLRIIPTSKSSIRNQQTDLTIIHSGAENIDLLRQVAGTEKFSVISSMLSLSLIPITQQFLQMLADLLTPDGVFIYLSIDREGMFSALRPEEQISGPWGYFKREDVTAKLNFLDTIVTDQIETPPNTHLIDQKLQTMGFRSPEKYRADGERLLSKHERILTSMYVYAEIRKI